MLNIFLYLLCLFAIDLSAYYQKPSWVSNAAWDESVPYLLPYNHPLRPKLDNLFQQKRLSATAETLRLAGFLKATPGERSKVVVCSHPKLKGFILKILTDDAKVYHPMIPEQQLWIHRIQGKNRIKEYIESHNLSGLFKVPNKWIYPLPTTAAPTSGTIPKGFILVCEDMNLVTSSMNRLFWTSNLITRERLDIIYALVTAVGYGDGLRPDNLFFSKDKQIAIVDTQKVGRWRPHYEQLLHYLSPPMKEYWKTKTL